MDLCCLLYTQKIMQWARDLNAKSCIAAHRPTMSSLDKQMSFSSFHFVCLVLCPCVGVAEGQRSCWVSSLASILLYFWVRVSQSKACKFLADTGQQTPRTLLPLPLQACNYRTCHWACMFYRGAGIKLGSGCCVSAFYWLSHLPSSTTLFFKTKEQIS